MKLWTDSDHPSVVDEVTVTYRVCDASSTVGRLVGLTDGTGNGSWPLIWESTDSAPRAVVQHGETRSQQRQVGLDDLMVTILPEKVAQV